MIRDFPERSVSDARLAWSPKNPLRIGTRGSKLALRQASTIRDLLIACHPFLSDAVDLSVIRTSGDRIKDRPLTDIGGKGLFTREIEQALDAGLIDMAVHSAKDVPMQLQPGHDLIAFPLREDARDIFLARDGGDWRALKPGSVVGTSSPRRQAQILMLRPDLVVRPMRGNVDTRLRKLAEGEADATILAVAGLRRLDLAPNGHVMDPALMLPAAGQGALAIEALSNRSDIRTLLAPLDHAPTHYCVLAERAVVTALEGSCRTPIAAFARIDGDQLILDSAIATPDGTSIWRDRRSGTPDLAAAWALGESAAGALLATAGDAAQAWRAA